MKYFKIKYDGNATRYKQTEWTVKADNERAAVIAAMCKYMDNHFFEDMDTPGQYRDQNGAVVMEPDYEVCEYDGGVFYAVLDNDY